MVTNYLCYFYIHNALTKLHYSLLYTVNVAVKLKHVFDKVFSGYQPR